MPRGINLRYTTHAVERWQERVSPGEGQVHIAQAFADAVPVPRGVIRPWVSDPNATCYRHATRPGVIFITRPCCEVPGAYILVTVVNMSRELGIPDSPDICADITAPGEWSEPAHEHDGARQEWLCRERETAVAVLSRFNKASRKHPIRREWAERVQMIESLLSQHRRDYRVWVRSQNGLLPKGNG